MSAVPKIIEGTWDDVLRHAQSLAGHRLRVIVLDDADSNGVHPALDNSPEALAAWGKRLERWAFDRQPLPPADDSREAIYNDRLDAQLDPKHGRDQYP